MASLYFKANVRLKQKSFSDEVFKMHNTKRAEEKLPGTGQI